MYSKDELYKLTPVGKRWKMGHKGEHWREKKMRMPKARGDL